MIATIMCGDGYFSEHEEAVVAQVQGYLQDLQPDIFLAGPAFRSGRYGLACGRLCLEAERLGIPAITGMHEENPGSDLYRPQHLYIIATAASAVGMQPALQRMAALAIKRRPRAAAGLGRRRGLPAARGPSHCGTGTPAAVRAVDMALKKWHGEPYTSELTVETFEVIPPPPPLSDPSKTLFALVTESGLVPRGNPDRLPSATATHWAQYSIAGWIGWCPASGTACTADTIIAPPCKIPTVWCPSTLSVRWNVRG